MTSEQFYQDIFEWIQELPKLAHKKRIIVGLNAPQGAGKTTLGNALEQKSQEANKPLMALSIDDFYLTNHEQNLLANQFSDLEYFQKRGYPGTHDMRLGSQTLEALKTESEVLVPRYDKSQFSGLGDRRPKAQWGSCSTEIEIILVEGWMLGFLPCEKGAVKMPEVNNALKAYENWYSHIDAFLQLKIEDFSWVVKWRSEAEENMKSQGQNGMTQQQVKDYANMFLPAYEIFSPTLEQFKTRFENSKTVEIGKNRLPVSK